ncbi:MAG TPA: xanthine dehydrogenase family protein molybdopterin-binding subunit, partial [Gemmataceae bacterium]|nr:xanthine dehydrogenase family protein molybdopterin-binding subunit [Gemmataceae bacterium]
GTKVQRLDGPEKATGNAKYSYDINRPGMLHARIFRSPHAHCKVKSIDSTAAEALPGFKAIHIIAKPGTELYWAGDEILALAADTEEHANDCLRAVKVEYDFLDHLVKEEDALKDDKQTAPPVGKDRKNVRQDRAENKGKIDAALKEADVTHEGTYGVPTICHQCLESHGLVAEWDAQDNLTVWCSTQATMYTAMGLAAYFKIPATRVKCITHHMGGGYGSKFGPDIQGTAAAALAKAAKAPVKLMLDRAEEATAGGVRPSAYATVKIGATKDGKITAFQAKSYGSSGIANSRTVGPMPYVYPIPNVHHEHTIVRLNTQSQRAMRAPGHPQSCVLTEGPIDDLAAKLGMDPMQVRLKNLPPNDEAAVAKSPTSLNALWTTIYTTEIKIAAQLAEWEKKWHAPGKGPGEGPVKHGMGMALHTWGGGGGGPNDVNVTIASDGSVLVQCSTQDLGTGERTVAAIITAETLGLGVKDITVRIGESQYGRSGGSGGSTTCPGTSPAFLNASSAARDALFDKIAGRLDAKKEDLAIQPGKIVDKANNKEWSWKEACARLGMDTVKGTGNWTPGLSNNGVGGVQIAEVSVDTETGVVRCTKVVAVQDCGLIINKQGCESQVAGGVVMAVNYALFEERIMDRNTGRQVNPNMEFYKLGGIEDMPQIVVHMHDMPERGVIGIGEPPTISTCAAIGNAIFNAIGVRVASAPFTPDKILAALAKGREA